MFTDKIYGIVRIGKMETIEEKPLETSYKLHRFLRYYLSNAQNIDDLEGNNDNSDALVKYLDYIENTLDETTPVCLLETETVVALLQNIDKANQERIKQYEIIKDFLIIKKIPELFFKVIYLLFEIYEFWFDEMAVPVRKKLFSNFGNYFTSICKNESKSGVKTLLEEKTTIQLEIIALSARLALNDSTNIENRIKDVCNDSFNICNSKEKYEKICQTRIDVETRLFKKMKNIKLLPYYFSLDDDYCDTFVGNIIIIRDKTTNESVSYQIVNRMHFPSYRRMFLTIKPKEFGYRNEDPEKLADKCKDFFRKISDKEGALALEVIKVLV